ncbi:MAG: type IV pili methyl-accepting chemotaxis transducer N-terminal domain-containing protein [Burkholderiaceae bacterium]|nr:type IV pili methyl-accepting chemotaxis transducer N-terminal domain-containing protein [Burkholderiaceae bacterium]
MALDMGPVAVKKRPKERSSRNRGDPFRASTTLDTMSPRTTMSEPAPKTVMLERAGSSGRAMRVMDRLIEMQLPVIGDKPVNSQVQILLALLVTFLVLFVLVLSIDNRAATNGAMQIEIVGDTLMHTQRLAKAAPNAVAGNRVAFTEVKESRDAIDSNLNALMKGDANRDLTASSSDAIVPELEKLSANWRASQSAASVILGNEKILLAFGDVIKKINDASPRLQQLTEEIMALKLQVGAPAREIATAGQLVTLTQRLGKSANSLVAGNVANAEVALTLGRDINQFRDLTQALLSGSEALRISAVTDTEARSRLQELLKVYGEFQKSIEGALGSLQAIVQAKEAELGILRDSEMLRQQVGQLSGLYTGAQRTRVLNFLLLMFFGSSLLLAGLAIFKVLLEDTRQRATEANVQRMQAERLEQDAKKTNDVNQAAILRLMNELQEVADGNLTVQATVSEDITGAIADSVNYTVEELRGLVGRINNTAEQVNTASTQARDIATRLLTASEAQSQEIKDTGDKVLKMASQINDVSKNAGESAKVARASLEAAERGQRAVLNQISGMNEIREQIQETAKRIKRLGESSQEIGEIVELITDITEQTNVLALNAAIQAASAGEAGRGFSVVAEEVQRLADRSAEAAKQIGALVRTIQTDTQDAVAAMEKSTQGVVEGAKLSDAAGNALSDIGRVSRQLTDQVEKIASATNDQAQSAGGVAHSIERILTVTEQTSQGTRQAAQSIGQLATLARELKASVARFRVG